MSEKTKMVTGGVYRRRIRGQHMAEVFGTMAGVRKLPNGRVEGRFITGFEQIEVMIEGSPEMDALEGPLFVGVEPGLAETVAELVAAKAEVEMRLAALERNKSPTPSAQADLADTKNRGARAVTTGNV